jgi:hypothetical protein
MKMKERSLFISLPQDQVTEFETRGKPGHRQTEKVERLGFSV